MEKYWAQRLLSSAHNFTGRHIPVLYYIVYVIYIMSFIAATYSQDSRKDLRGRNGLYAMKIYFYLDNM